MTASRLRKMTGTKKFRGTPLEEMATGKRPDVRNLRIFGCGVWIFVRGKHLKLDPRARKAFFLGVCPTAAIEFETSRSVKLCM